MRYLYKVKSKKYCVLLERVENLRKYMEGQTSVSGSGCLWGTEER